MAKAIYKMYDVLGFILVHRLVLIIMFIIPIILSEFFELDLNNKYILVPWIVLGIFCFVLNYFEIKYIAKVKKFSNCEERIKYIMKWRGKAITSFSAGSMLANINRDDIALFFLNYVDKFISEQEKYEKLIKEKKYENFSYEDKYKLVNSIILDNKGIYKIYMQLDTGPSLDGKLTFRVNNFMNSYFKMTKEEIIELGFEEYLDD